MYKQFINKVLIQAKTEATCFIIDVKTNKVSIYITQSAAKKCIDRNDTSQDRTEITQARVYIHLMTLVDNTR